MAEEATKHYCTSKKLNRYKLKEDDKNEIKCYFKFLRPYSVIKDFMFLLARLAFTFCIVFFSISCLFNSETNSLFGCENFGKLDNIGNIMKLVDCTLFSIVNTMGTVGYAKIEPNSFIGSLFIDITVVSSCLFFLFGVNLVFSIASKYTSDVMNVDKHFRQAFAQKYSLKSK